MNDQAITTIITAVISAISMGGGAVFFGIWDRKRTAKQDELSGSSLERKELSENWHLYIKSIEADRERKRARIDTIESEIQKIEFDKDCVWAAFRRYEGLVQAFRHELIRRIWHMQLQLDPTGPKPEPFAELPSINALYSAEKAKLASPNPAPGAN